MKKLILLLAALFICLCVSELILMKFHQIKIKGGKKLQNQIEARKRGIKYDKRTISKVIDDFKKDGIEAWPSVRPHMLWVNDVENSSILPLGGISKSKTVVCNESGEYFIYESDEHGFNNPMGLYKPGQVDIAIIGDSFAQGFCVPPDKNAAAVVREKYKNTLNFGTGGSGPLTYLATLREFVKPLKPQVVLWFHSETNDLHNLSFSEIKSRYLTPYLNENYSNGLIHKQDEVDHLIKGFVREKRILRKPVEGPNLPVEKITKKEIISKIKRSTKKISDFFEFKELKRRLIKKKKPRFPVKYDIDLFEEILKSAKKTVEGWDGKIYLVYIPEWHRYQKQYHSDGIGMKSLPFSLYGDVIEIAGRLGYSIIDVQKEVEKNNSPESLYVFGQLNHFNEEGYRLVGKAILKALDSPADKIPAPKKPFPKENSRYLKLDGDDNQNEVYERRPFFYKPSQITIDTALHKELHFAFGLHPDVRSIQSRRQPFIFTVSIEEPGHGKKQYFSKKISSSRFRKLKWNQVNIPLRPFKNKIITIHLDSFEIDNWNSPGFLEEKRYVIWSSIGDPERKIEKKPLIVFLSINGLREDRLNSRHASLKNLHRLSGKNIISKNKILTSTNSIKGLYSLFSGKRFDRNILSNEEVSRMMKQNSNSSLVPTLKSAGYTTIGLIGTAGPLSDHNFFEGFDLFVELGSHTNNPNDYLVGQARKYMNKAISHPLFLFIHFDGLHRVFRNQKSIASLLEEDKSYWIQKYDEELKKIDRSLSLLIHDLLRIKKDVLVVVTSPYARKFNEVPTYIPLILFSPNKRFSRSQPAAEASLVDVFPTIMDFINYPYDPDNFDGRSLLN